jgi:hypothetical protein
MLNHVQLDLQNMVDRAQNRPGMDSSTICSFRNQEMPIMVDEDNFASIIRGNRAHHASCIAKGWWAEEQWLES